MSVCATMRRKEDDRRRVRDALEKALAYREAGHPAARSLGLAVRLDQFVAALRVEGRSETQAIALLRRNPGLIRLH